MKVPSAQVEFRVSCDVLFEMLGICSVIYAAPCAIIAFSGITHVM